MLDTQLVDFLMDPDNKQDLVATLTYHLIENATKSTDLLPFGSPSQSPITTVNGDDIVLKLGYGGEYDIKINDASVIDPIDVMACGGGVLHTIDMVLMPSDDPPERGSSDGIFLGTSCWYHVGTMMVLFGLGTNILCV